MPIEEPWLEVAVNQRLAAVVDKSLAVDVGASSGSWTSELSKHFRRTIAIEPDHRAYMRIDTARNVEIIPAVATDRSGYAVLHIRTSPDQNSLLETHPIGLGGGLDCPAVNAVNVRCLTLDELCPQGADFVKIDVEGAEASVLRGCSGDGRWGRTVFVVECHDTKSEVEQELSRLGKTQEWIFHPLSGAHPGHCWAVT